MKKYLDAIKEFSIRAIDGSKTTEAGFSAIGKNADEMAERFAAGGERAREAFFETIQALGEMEDAVAQDAAGVALFGTMWEDLGKDVVLSLDKMDSSFDRTKQTMEDINDIKYDSIGKALEGVKRSVQTELLLPLSEEAMPTLNEFAKEAKDSVKEVAEAFEKGGLQGLSKSVGKQVANCVTEVAKMSPTFVQAGVELVKGVAEGIKENAPQIADAAGEVVSSLAEGVGDMVPILKPVTSAISLLGDNMKVTIPVVTSLTAALLAMKAAKSVITTIDGLSASFHTARAAARAFIPGVSTSLTAYQAVVGTVTREINASVGATTLLKSALTALGGPVGIAAAAIGALAAGVLAYSAASSKSESASEKNRKAIEKLNESLEEQKKAYEDMEEKSQKNIDASLYEIDTAENLAKSIMDSADSIVDANGKVKKGYEDRAKALVDKVNSIVPEAIELTEKEGDMYLKTADKLAILINNKKLNAVLDSRSDLYASAMENQQTNLEKVIEAEKELKIAIEERDAATKKMQDNRESFDYANEWEKAKNKVLDAQQAYNSAIEQMRNDNELLQEQEKITTGILSDSNEEKEAILQEFAYHVKEYGMEQVEQAKIQRDQLKEQYDTLVKLAEDTSNGITQAQIEGAKKAYDMAQVIYDNTVQASKEAGKAQADAQAAGIEEGTPAVVEAQANLNNQVTEEAAKMESQIEGIAENTMDSFGRKIQEKESGLLGIVQLMVSKVKNVFTSVQGFDINSPSKWAKRVGGSVMEGLGNGVEENSSLPIDATSQMITDVKETVEGKQGFDINSPSKWAYGVSSFVIEGFAEGISDNGESLIEAFEALSAQAMEKAKKEAESYEAFGKIYSESYLSGIEEIFDDAQELIKEGIDQRTEVYQKAVEAETEAKIEALEEQEEALKEKKTKANEKEIEEQLKAIEKQKDSIKQASKEQIALAKEQWEKIEKTQQNAIKTAYSNIEAVLEENMDAVTSRFQTQYDEIARQQEQMQSKLSGYGELFSYDEEGKLLLNDIEDISKGIEEYYTALEELKQKGASEDFLKEVLSFDIEDAAKYMDELTSMSSTQLEEYLSDWEALQKLKMEGAQKQFESQYREVQRGFVLAMEEINGEVPELLYSVMADSLSGLKEEMPKEYAAVYEKLLADIQNKLDNEAKKGITANIALNQKQLEQTAETAKEALPGQEEAKASMEAVTETIKQEAPAVKGCVGEIAEGAVSVLASYEGDFGEIGGDYIDAVIEAMLAKKEAAIQTAGQIADAIKKRLRAASEEGSIKAVSEAEGVERLLEGADHARLDTMIRSMQAAVMAQQYDVAKSASVGAGSQIYKDNSVINQGDIRFTVHTQQINENDINKMLERANFERRKRSIATGRK